MKLVNITLPEHLQKKMVRVVQDEYTSSAEFVRSSALRLLSQHQVLSPAMKIDFLRKRVHFKMHRQKEYFSPEQELRELKKVRDRAYYARRS